MDNYKFIYIIKCSRYTLGECDCFCPPCPFDEAGGLLAWWWFTGSLHFDGGVKLLPFLLFVC